MSKASVRRASAETFDFKQRFTGAIVLFILMLVLYVILKALLGGFSMTPTGSYALGERLPDEVPVEEGGPQVRPDESVTVSSAVLSNRSIPTRFVFLNLDGEPMRDNTEKENTETGEAENDTPVTSPDTFQPPDDGKTRWFVQAASFRDRARARKLVGQLKENGLDAAVYPLGVWHTVRLKPHLDRRKAEYELQQLRTNAHIKGLIKRLN